MTTQRHDSRLFLVVTGVVVVALALRLFTLGDRIAHWDEARVAYWILDYLRTGNYTYRPIIHGPFLQQVNRVVFALIGPSDFAMRLPVAMLGGLLPAAALLFRAHLDDWEVVALSLWLAFTPVLLYYSRFMRGDLPVAAFSLIAVGFFVRTLDTGRRRYLYAGVASLALAMTVKENVIVTIVTWVGAAVLLLDYRLLVARERDWTWPAVSAQGKQRLAALRPWTVPLALAAVELVAIITVFYAPRSGEGGPDFATALLNPGLLPGIVWEATVGSWISFYSLWVLGDLSEHAYVPYLVHFVETLAVGGGALTAFAVVGFVAARYRPEGHRELVSFFGYWGFVSILGYPIVTDIMAPWAIIHAVVPLSIPAAVGLAWFARAGRSAVAARDYRTAGLTAVILLLAVSQVTLGGVSQVYLQPQAEDNQLVQYGQPADDLRPTLNRIERVAAANDGVDVLYFGEFFYITNETSGSLPERDKWFNQLPLPWYTAMYDANVTSARNRTQFDPLFERERPPVIITIANDRGYVTRRIGVHEGSGYDEEIYRLRTFGTRTAFFVNESAVPRTEVVTFIPPPSKSPDN
ncbi:flippase activity-associated protein Agl23 [Haladaptatus sp. DYSN1]|uniref:flippase activity-associated protein Agl23 n=1 Tax=unclassified Haladaptatus TaxID=2622732 RepID=UPI00240775ED|nr:flippase activity-associated protein Agl23 [Haladaptatus sp. DYSN1]